MTNSIERLVLPSNIGIIKPIGQQTNFAGYYTTPTIKPDIFVRQDYVTKPFTKTAKFYHNVLNAFSSDALLKTFTKDENAQRLLAQNPKAIYILKENGLDVKVNPSNISDIKAEHIDSTVEYAGQIAKTLGLSNKDLETIHKGAIFHDYGKILIPETLLNKTSRLSKEEKQVVDLHAKLGYELLQNTPLDEDTLKIIRDHHKPLKKDPDIRTQVVTVADIYSALTTNRPYKKPLSQDESLSIMQKLASEEKISPMVLEALASSLN